jgi:hypothetical protein
MGGIFQLGRWDGLRYRNIHTKFHKYWSGRYNINRGIHRHTQTATWYHKPTLFFKNKEIRLKINTETRVSLRSGKRDWTSDKGVHYYQHYLMFGSPWTKSPNIWQAELKKCILCYKQNIPKYTIVSNDQVICGRWDDNLRNLHILNNNTIK